MYQKQEFVSAVITVIPGLVPEHSASRRPTLCLANLPTQLSFPCVKRPMPVAKHYAPSSAEI